MSAWASHMLWRMCHLRPVDLLTNDATQTHRELLGTTEKKDIGQVKLMRVLYAPFQSQDDRVVIK